ncbi:PAS domain S-box protein, partial [Chloroflexota bacterium]
NIQTAVDAVNQGAYAYFVKPVNPYEIKTTVANALKQQRLSKENKRLIESLQLANMLLDAQNEELRDEITEHKRTEEELRESEERYRDLFENANDLIQSVTPEGSFLYVNKAWREKLGYNEEEITTLTVWDIIHPDSVPHCTEAFQKVISGETVNNVEAVFVAKDGILITVEGNANCRVEEGKVVASRGIFRDITARKQAEELYRNLSENSPVGVYIFQDGKFKYVNPRF